MSVRAPVESSVRRVDGGPLLALARVVRPSRSLTTVSYCSRVMRGTWVVAGMPGTQTQRAGADGTRVPGTALTGRTMFPAPPTPVVTVLPAPPRRSAGGASSRLDVLPMPVLPEEPGVPVPVAMPPPTDPVQAANAGHQQSHKV